MFFFKRRKKPAPSFDAPLAPDAPFFAIGDIHGRDDLLQRLLSDIEQAAPSGARIVFVGDYIDRGEESAQVLRRLRQMQQEQSDRVICLMGNHEDMLLQFLEDPAARGPRWLNNGGLQTMASFRVAPVTETAPAEAWQEARDALRVAMGQELEDWLRQLPTLWESGNMAAVHAGADPAVPMADQSAHTLMWGHSDFVNVARTDGIWVLHGHTIVDQAAANGGRISLDTGAYATGRLTAALVEPGNLRFLST